MQERADKLEQEAKESYLTVDQFSHLHRSIELASRRLKEQQVYIDTMEKKMIS